MLRKLGDTEASGGPEMTMVLVNRMAKPEDMT